jgi:hypothetical protein
MFNIQKEIEQIIKNQDFIVLPNIGAFISEYSKPYFDENEEIVPPIKQFEFNEIIDKDLDEKLFGLIHQNSKLSFDEIKTEYRNFIKNFRSEIVLNKKYLLQGIGVLYKNEDNKIAFFPENSPQNIESKEYIEEQKMFFELDNTLIFNESEEEDEVEEQDEMEEEIGENKRNFTKFFLYIFPLVVLSAALTYSIFIKPTEKKSEKKNIVEKLDTLAKFKVKTLKDSVESIQKLEVPIENKSLNKIESKKDFIVSIGVFSKKENVDNLASYLAENGFPTRVRPIGKKYKLYVVASSESQALDYIEKIEKLTDVKPVYQN